MTSKRFSIPTLVDTSFPACERRASPLLLTILNGAVKYLALLKSLGAVLCLPCMPGISPKCACTVIKSVDNNEKQGASQPMHRAAAYGSTRASQRGCAHALEPPSAEGHPWEHRLPAAKDAPVAIVCCRSVLRLAPRLSLLLTLLMTVLMSSCIAKSPSAISLL